MSGKAFAELLLRLCIRVAHENPIHSPVCLAMTDVKVIQLDAQRESVKRQGRGFCVLQE